MKRLWIFLLALVMFTVPVFASGNLVRDEEGLLTADETAQLESLYEEFVQDHGFTPILLTTESFAGISAESYAEEYYDSNDYPADGILLLVSLSEGQWYILTNGECYDRISDSEAYSIGERLASAIRKGDYYDAFSTFPVLAQLQMQGSSTADKGDGEAHPGQKSYGRIVAICMGVGVLIGLIVVGIMASQMKSVRPQYSAGDYVRPGSMQLTHSRDIFLYSHVHRTPKPKSNSSGGSSGGSRGGAGGRL